jgi:hypothetical protein
MVASVGTGAVAGGTFALSWYLRSRFEEPDSALTVGQLNALRTQTNATSVAAPALAALALGLGAVAVVTW